MARMKVLQIGASWLSHHFSGLERYYAELVAHLPRLGTDVTGLVYEWKDCPQVCGLRLVSFGTQDKSVARKFLDQRRIIKTYLNNEIGLVVSHCTPSLFPALRYLGEKPLICHFHGPRYLERVVEGANPVSVQLSKYIEHKVYARTQHIITLSHYMKRVLMETYAFPEERISVIPGGVNLEHFRQRVSREEARQQLELPQRRPVILTVRRLDRRMGLHNLVEAMSEVVRIVPDVLLLIVGKGPLQTELNHHIQSRSLSSNVRMMGAVADELLPLLYRAADFSIVPTTDYEGFGLILVESLASGTPVLGTPRGAIPEVLTPLAESLLFKSPAPQHLAEGIQDVLSGKRILPSMELCESYAAQNYAWPHIVSEVLSVYRGVLGNYPRAYGRTARVANGL
jgi:glycosyltransferase involved in cell wall biosynthesis